MNIRWVDRGRASVRCPLCRTTAERPLIAKVRVKWRRRRIGLIRCPECGTVVPTAVLPPYHAYEGESWDWDAYVEQLAGIEVLATMLALVDAPPGSTFLDVGCGFGFGLDLAVRLRGWNGTGLDPSEGAERGREALGLDLRRELLDASFEPGRRFDVIFCSEVVEHLGDPQPVLAEIRDRLEPGGVAVITVPDAAVIARGRSLTVAEPAISIGHHEFVPTIDGFRALLADSGLVAEVWSTTTNLVAVAAADPTGLARVRRGRTVSLGDLAEYAGRHVDTAPTGSALAVGMAMRRVKFLAFDGRIEESAAAISSLAEALRDRYGVEFGEPDSIATDDTEVPAVLAGACYFAGLGACIVDRDPLRGDRYLRAAVRSARAYQSRFDRYVDPEVSRFEMEALGELAALLAPTDPDGARKALADLDASARRVGDRTFADRYHERLDAVLA